jgi:pyrroloquinoline quinone (PQQ) biosynthesis protein C
MSLSDPPSQRLLAVMDQKHHWAYPALTRPGLTRAQLREHFRHEFLVYVRDFPILLARALGQVPPLPDVRARLAENLYEEQTGGISRTAPHPELFLRMMGGLGFDRNLFEDDDTVLHPAARAYRDWLKQVSCDAPWQAAVAVLTIFVEGSVNERAELEGTFVRVQGESAVTGHPLVVHYECPPSAMELARAHAAVEGGHRSDAWRIVLSHLDDETIVKRVIESCVTALAMWQRYRDGVAERMGLARERAA